MNHLVQFSTGAGSAEVAARVVQAHGPASVTLMTADTRVEDGDNWRFAFEVWKWLDRPRWVYLRDGRTPMEAGRDAKCVPNNMMAVCSRVLKRELLRGYIDANYEPGETVVYEGYDWTEPHRFDAARPHWGEFHLAAPMMDDPKLDKSQILDLWRERNIIPPRLYDAKFSHANCGGGCVRGGQAAWRRLYYWNPERYREWECEEEKTRAMLGKDVAILKIRSGPREGDPLPLRDFRKNLESDASLFDASDHGACGCSMPVDPTETSPSLRDPYVAVIGEPGAPTLDELAVNW